MHASSGLEQIASPQFLAFSPWQLMPRQLLFGYSCVRPLAFSFLQAFQVSPVLSSKLQVTHLFRPFVLLIFQGPA